MTAPKRKIKPFTSGSSYCVVAKHAVPAEAEFTLVSSVRGRLRPRYYRRSACGKCAADFATKFGVPMPVEDSNE